MYGFFSESSTSTNVGDLEEFFWHLDAAENTTPDTSVQPQLSSTYDLRSRTVTKVEKNKGSKSKVQKRKKKRSRTPRIRNSKRQEPKIQKNQAHSTTRYIETESFSQESISMLRECYMRSKDVTSTENGSQDENVLNADPRPRSPRGGSRYTIKGSTAMEFPMLLDVKKEREITKRAKFMKCIIQLKFMIFLKDKKADTNLHDILNAVKTAFGENIGEAEADERDATLLKEKTREYVSRITSSDKGFCETAQALLLHFENIFRENFLEVAGCWRKSVYEMAVDLLNEAANCDSEIRKSIESFLFRLLKSIVNDEERSKNLVLESKAALVLMFCKSTCLSFSLICYIIGQLKRLNAKPLGLSPLAEKLSWSSFVKNLLVLLRVLEISLESVKSELQIKETEEVLNKEEAIKNVNVFEMWKKHWRADEPSRKAKTEQSQGKVMIRNWFSELDQVLRNCMNHFPISAMAVDRCKMLVMEILKICSPEESLRAQKMNFKINM